MKRWQRSGKLATGRRDRRRRRGGRVGGHRGGRGLEPERGAGLYRHLRAGVRPEGARFPRFVLQRRPRLQLRQRQHHVPHRLPLRRPHPPPSECNYTAHCVTFTGGGEWCSPVAGVQRYELRGGDEFATRLTESCGQWSGGEACVYELLLDGAHVASSGGYWYSVGAPSVEVGGCPPETLQDVCGNQLEQNFVVP